MYTCFKSITMNTSICELYISPHIVYFILSLENFVMAASKRCVKLFSLIFVLKCSSKSNVIRNRKKKEEKRKKERKKLVFKNSVNKLWLLTTFQMCPVIFQHFCYYTANETSSDVQVGLKEDGSHFFSQSYSYQF